MKKKALFIINPISGTQKKNKLPDIISSTVNKEKLDYEIVFTERPGHATELALSEGVDYFIATGGDGTINEVAKSLIGTSSVMGIIPMGSGNGLARHLGIPMNITKAIQAINNLHETTIDTCSINGEPFVNMAGVGFDAHIGKMFAEAKGRGFQTYITTTLNEFKTYKAQHYKLSVGGESIERDAFLVSFANSSQYGNNAYIAPQANIQDGMLDVCMMKPFRTHDILELGFRLFNKTINKSSLIETVQASELTVERENTGVLHLDGEPMEMGKKLTIKVLPGSLKILVP